MTTDNAKYLSNLHHLINQYLNLEDTRTLCLNLDIDCESFPKEEISAFIREIILTVERDGRLSELINILQKEHPYINWPPMPQDFQPPSPDKTQSHVMASGTNIHGDVIQGDKFSGDKIAGDKISGEIVVTGYVAGDIIVNYAAQPDIPPPPPPLRPPIIDLLIGRDDALTYFENNLHQFGLAVLSGMAGIGKTTLAATLARRQAPIENIFWHVFHEGEGVDSVIWRLAGFLATNGQADLWHMLQTITQTGGQLPPPNILFDFLIQQLNRQPYLLCLDDFHYVDDDPRLLQLVTRLQPLLTANQLHMIITTRRIPDFVKGINFTALEGLDANSVRHLLAVNDVVVDDEIANQLHLTTGGNAGLLTLAIDLLQGAYDPAKLVKNLVETDDIEDYLMDEIEDNLSRNERMVMGAVSILQNHPGTQAAIEAIIDGRRIRRVLRDLSDRFLITVTHKNNGRLYNQHAIVQSFFYAGLNQRERHRMHHRAGEYYQDTEPDFLLAARHFFAADDLVSAAELATTNVQTFINKGEARQLSTLLTRFNASQLDSEHWLRVQLALGQTHAYFGENPTARTIYKNALATVENSRKSKTDIWYPRFYLALGNLLGQESPPEALEWYAKGMNAVDPTLDDQNVQTALLIGSGTVQMYLNEFSEAQQALQVGLDSLPSEPSQLLVTALENLSMVVANAEGDFTKAITLALQALDLSEQLNDRFKAAEITATIGIFHHMADDWATAIQYFEQALAAAQQLGNERLTAKVLTNLGTALMYSGDYERANTLLEQGLAVACNTHQHLGEGLLLSNLARLNLLTGQWQVAHQQLAEVETLATDLGMDFLLIDVWVIRAELALAEGIDDPLPLAQRALELAQEMGEPVDEGNSLKVFAQAVAAAGQLEDSEKVFAQSYALLEIEDRFGAALCQLAWAESILDFERERAMMLLQNALAIFDQLGAEPESRRAKQLLAKVSVI